MYSDTYITLSRVRFNLIIWFTYSSSI